jgi:hypothetical protein
VVVPVALLAAAAFGAADQYLGSFSAHPWATQVSLLSAPWLLVAFLAGWTQRDARRAALLGLGCTFSALVGYGLMTLSPVENAELTVQSVSGFVRSERAVVAGGLVTGPLFGWLGYRWRNDRAWVGALLVAAAVCLEPLARVTAGDPIAFRSVWIAEVVVGLALAAYVAAVTLATQVRARRLA